MQLVGEQRIAASRQRVWEALNDPAVLRAAIPGCQSLEKQGEDRFKATVEIKIGPIGARFNGSVKLANLDPPNGYTLSGEGNGGIAGMAKGNAKVKLAETGDGTLLSYTVDAEVGGRLAQLGGPIIDATAKQLAGRFFARFGDIVEGRPTPALAAAVPTPAAVPQAMRTGGAGFPVAWVLAVALAAVLGFVAGQKTAGPVVVLDRDLLTRIAAEPAR
ncbi:hypothetical protein GCM10009087_16650 [Sphingomonas oligophenolica]|uniref:Carbon monoxide dehydrogenase subunit G n=1 Tax=Sphingomonas oligophenolica TaxID=301154 RepID=A0ABU9Y7S1_9SPHN